MAILGFLVLLNPFFGCVIAWMLLYQSDKDEAFVVLGLEGASLMLHFISVWIEGSVKNCRTFLCHMIPLIPFLASIGLTSFYFCLLYTSPSPRDKRQSRMPSSA